MWSFKDLLLWSFWKYFSPRHLTKGSRGLQPPASCQDSFYIPKNIRFFRRDFNLIARSSDCEITLLENQFVTYLFRCLYFEETSYHLPLWTSRYKTRVRRYQQLTFYAASPNHSHCFICTSGQICFVAICHSSADNIYQGTGGYHRSIIPKLNHNTWQHYNIWHTD